MRSFFGFIAALIHFYIINPIKRWWNLHIKHRYIPDNPRNQEVLEYLIRVAEDPTTQPQSPVEHYIENQMEQDFYRFYNEETDPPWEEMRHILVIDLASQMMEFPWIDDRDYDD